MADEINLPNLVSHLQVNLANTSGIAADAARQGSAVGAALGAGIQREVRDAVTNIPDVQIDANSTDLDRDLARVREELDQLASQRISVDISIEDALRQLDRLEPHLDRLSHTHQTSTSGPPPPEQCGSWNNSVPPQPPCRLKSTWSSTSIPTAAPTTSASCPGHSTASARPRHRAPARPAWLSVESPRLPWVRVLRWPRCLWRSPGSARSR
ncbi:hypothetical protein [Streptomyces sp. 900116325]